MADFGKQQDFRKGSILRKLHEDPTYLSFFLAFETSDREGSPLLSGAAKDYLTKVLRADEGNKYAKHLENFQKVLMKINREMPWFWQSLAGIDTAMTLNAMHPDIIVIRHQDSGAPNLLSQKVNCAVINAGDGRREHPTQALLDAYSVKEKIGDLKNKKILIVGDSLHSRVALSNIYAYQKLGANVTVCGPKSLIPKLIPLFFINLCQLSVELASIVIAKFVSFKISFL